MKMKSLLFFATLIVNICFATTPKLNFTDLISGPDTGLGDGLGSGVIVTVWGQNLGSSQGTSAIIFTDANNVSHQPAHIYYWKNADGNLPSGPANLFESHKMQEIAFSVPDATLGLGLITVSVNGETSNSLPFTVRDGNIYHVKSSGNDSSGTGTFGNSWLTVNNALSEINSPGTTLYVHDSVTSGNSTSHRAIYWNNSSASSGLNNQFGVLAFPNSQPKVIGYSGFRNYRTEGQVVSKFDIYASECQEDSNGQPVNCASTPSLNLTYGIQTSAYGRAVGNAITDQPGGCADGTQAAISGNALSGRDRVSGVLIFGNEVYEYGCVGSSKLHHTTYLSIRSGGDDLQVPPWRFGWNYLHDNKTKNGIHQYDENNSGWECGSPNDTVKIHDNVILNQSGAGINIGANCPWTNDFEVYNNVLINVGLAADWDGIDPSTANGPNTSGISVQDGGLSGTIKIFNNTIHTWNNDDPANDTQACLGMQGSKDWVSVIWENNICYTDKDKHFVNHGCCGAEVQLDNVAGLNNFWYYNGANPATAIAPTWDNMSILDNPLLQIIGSQVTVNSDSPIIGTSTNTVLAHDIYGIPRLPNADVGAVEYLVIPGDFIFTNGFE